MGHAADQPPHGFHLLRLAQLCFQLLRLGNIACGRQHARLPFEFDQFSRHVCFPQLALRSCVLHTEFLHHSPFPESADHLDPLRWLGPEEHIRGSASNHIPACVPDQPKKCIVHVQVTAFRFGRDRDCQRIAAKSLAESLFRLPKQFFISAPFHHFCFQHLPCTVNLGCAFQHPLLQCGIGFFQCSLCGITVYKYCFKEHSACFGASCCLN